MDRTISSLAPESSTGLKPSNPGSPPENGSAPAKRLGSQNRYNPGRCSGLQSINRASPWFRQEVRNDGWRSVRTSIKWRNLADTYCRIRSEEHTSELQSLMRI